VRIFILILSLLWIAILGVLTVRDIAHNGVSALDVISIAILVLFSTGIVGALRHPPE
jgi:hypothetical protein